MEDGESSIRLENGRLRVELARKNAALADLQGSLKSKDELIAQLNTKASPANTRIHRLSYSK